MKKIKLIDSSIIFIIILTIISCRKDKKADYRDKYIGNYEFYVNILEFNIQDSIFLSSDTTYDGNIHYGSDYNKILIQFQPNYTLEPIIQENGNLINDLTLGSQNSEFSGKFETENKLSFQWTYGPQNNGISFHVIGIRK